MAGSNDREESISSLYFLVSCTLPPVQPMASVCPKSFLSSIKGREEGKRAGRADAEGSGATLRLVDLQYN